MTPSAVILTVLGYLAIHYAVAGLSARKAGNAAFFTGERHTPWPMAALAMIGAAMSGVTFISVPGSVATDAFSYMQMVAGFTVGQFIVAYLLIPTLYRHNVVSMYEYLENRFGTASHRTGAWFFFLSKMSGAALKVYVVCAVMQSLVFRHYAVPFWANALLTMAFVWLYTRKGGVKSLIWTDALKTLCLVGSLALTLFCISRSLGLDFSSFWHTVGSSPYSQVLFLDDPSSDRYFWKMFPAGIVLLVAMTGLDQDLMQKNMSCASPRDAQKNIATTALCQIVVILLFLLLGVLLYTYIDIHGMPLPEKSDQVFPMVAVNGQLPLIAGILFVVGLVSSTYAAAGSALTALTTSFTMDLLGGRRLEEKQLTATRRGVHGLMALVMFAVILAFEYLADDSVINLIFKVAGYTYGPILGMFLFGLFTRTKVRDRYIPLVAVAAPLLSAALQYAAREYFDYQIGFELLIYNALFMIAGMAALRKNSFT